ncbi:hypothetical protein Syun_010204 [Stephania yunnanensis]|uniref:Uncharacterized protein n=1 Tax=Stephania yunnanensis TaxID=152371 RepID=A0AAP0KH22_9MAGN
MDDDDVDGHKKEVDCDNWGLGGCSVGRQGFRIESRDGELRFVTVGAVDDLGGVGGVFRALVKREQDRSGSDTLFAVVDGGGHGVVVDSDILVGVPDSDVEEELRVLEPVVLVEGGDGEGADVEAGAVGAEGEPEDEGEDAADEEEGEEDGAEEFDEAAAEAVAGVVAVEGGAVGAARGREGWGRGRGLVGAGGWMGMSVWPMWGCIFWGGVGGGREGGCGGLCIGIVGWGFLGGGRKEYFWGLGDCLVMVVWF